MRNPYDWLYRSSLWQRGGAVVRDADVLGTNLLEIDENLRRRMVHDGEIKRTFGTIRAC